MRRFQIVPLIIYVLLSASVFANAQTVSNGKATTAAPAYTNNTARPLSLDLLGNLRVSGGAGATAQEVQGNVAAGVADVGNPVKTGAVNNTTLPTYASGQRGDMQLGTRGSVHVTLFGQNVASAAVLSASATSTDGTTASNVLYVGSFNQKLSSGTTWERDFTCSNSAVVTVTAGATTQIVALSGSTVIRVCSFTITSSLAGTAQFLYGTGANCATGPTNLTGAMNIAAAGNISSSAGSGSLFRGVAANALCLAAVTGNISGFLSFAQY